MYLPSATPLHLSSLIHRYTPLLLYTPTPLPSDVTTNIVSVTLIHLPLQYTPIPLLSTHPTPLIYHYTLLSDTPLPSDISLQTSPPIYPSLEIHPYPEIHPSPEIHHYTPLMRHTPHECVSIRVSFDAVDPKENKCHR